VQLDCGPSVEEHVLLTSRKGEPVETARLASAVTVPRLVTVTVTGLLTAPTPVAGKAGITAGVT
jgi:hypothetical protein